MRRLIRSIEMNEWWRHWRSTSAVQTMTMFSEKCFSQSFLLHKSQPISPQNMFIGWSRFAFRTACCLKTSWTESTRKNEIRFGLPTALSSNSWANICRRSRTAIRVLPEPKEVSSRPRNRRVCANQCPERQLCSSPWPSQIIQPDIHVDLR